MPSKQKDRGIFQRLIESWEGIDPEEGDLREQEADYAQEHWAPVNRARGSEAPRTAKSGAMYLPVLRSGADVILPEEEAQTLAEQRFYREHGRIPSPAEGGRVGAPAAPESGELADLGLLEAEEDVEARIQADRKLDRLERIKRAGRQ